VINMVKCKNSYSDEHAYMPYGLGKIKCSICGHVTKVLNPK
jgi:hypothetical protein